MLFFFAPKPMPRISSSVLVLGHHGAPYLSSFGRCGIYCRALVLILASTFVSAATMGSFSGEVVRGVSVENGKHWVYVKSGKSTVRRVDISEAQITYDAQVPRAHRSQKPADDIRQGTRLSVTASQDESGEWKASKLEIVSVPGKPLARPQSA
jgi:hypothetical protein